MTTRGHHGLLMGGYFSSPVIDLPFNGANGSTTMTDNTGRTWTAFGNAQNSTAQFVEGSASLLLDGAGDYISTPSTPDIQNNGDFRIECSLRPANVTSLRCICSKRPSIGIPEFNFMINASGNLQFQVWDTSGALLINITSSSSFALNTWQDAAVERIGNTYRILFGNTVESSASGAPAFVGTNDLKIGRDTFTTARDFNGYIDRFRFLR